jgi:ketosteroid isomerase-like protein
MAGFSYNGNGEVALNPEDPKPSGPAGEQAGGVGENVELEEFFQRLPANFRWPKPSAESVAAAVEAIQRMSGGTETEELPAEGIAQPDDACAGCGGSLPSGARFCVWCGLAKNGVAPGASPDPQTRAGGQHHYHHHYHHFVPGQGTGPGASSAGEPATSAPRGKVSGPASAGSGNSRAEVAARQVVQDWAQACNTKHLDDLLELYSADATVIRASLPPVRSLPAIREFLFSLLEAGLGDVEMESLRVDVMGEVALDLGRCKMLVPVAMGKRREERGKYLVVLVRQSTGTWKILADCWSSDLVVSAPSAPEVARKGTEPTGPARKVR